MVTKFYIGNVYIYLINYAHGFTLNFFMVRLQSILVVSFILQDYLTLKSLGHFFQNVI